MCICFHHTGTNRLILGSTVHWQYCTLYNKVSLFLSLKRFNFEKINDLVLLNWCIFFVEEHKMRLKVLEFSNTCFFFLSVRGHKCIWSIHLPACKEKENLKFYKVLDWSAIVSMRKHLPVVILLQLFLRTFFLARHKAKLASGVNYSTE